MNEIFGVGYMISGCGIGIYAGATTRPDERIPEHLSALKANRHWNLNFQAAVNDHGIESFTVIFTPPVQGLEQIAKTEQALINAAKSSDEILFNKHQKVSKHHSVGYELSPETRARQGQAKRKHYEFVSPGGETVKVHGLVSFCEQYRLSKSEMCRLASGKRESYRGWTRAEKTPTALEFQEKSTISPEREPAT